jgi:hypothetical protein
MRNGAVRKAIARRIYRWGMTSKPGELHVTIDMVAI